MRGVIKKFSLLLNLRVLIAGFLFVLWAITAGSPLARADRKAIVFPDASVHANADEYSEVVGTYHKRTTVTVADQPQSGWYRVIFPSPVKGFTEGWIKEDAIEGFAAVPKGKKRSQTQSEDTRPTKRRKSRDDDEASGKETRTYIGLNFDFMSASPSTAQGTIGEKKESFYFPAYGLEIGTRFASSVSGFAGISMYSFTRPSSVATTGSYSAKGFLFDLGADVLIVHTTGFSLGLGGGLGVSLNTAGNAAPNGSGTVVQESTSGIFTPTYQVRFVMDKSLGGGFGVRLGIGYRVLKLSAVPVTAIGSNITTTAADFSLTGPYAGLGLDYAF